MNFIKSSYLSAFSTGTNILARLVINKITALYVGANGFAIYGQFKDFVSIITSISQLGTENGVIKYTAETYEDLDEFKRFLSTAIKIHLLSATIAIVFILIFKDWINSVLFKNLDYTCQISLIGASIIFISLYNLVLNIINGLKQIQKFITITIITTIATSLTTIIAVKYFQLLGLIFSLALNHVLVFLISIFFIQKFKSITLNFLKLTFEKKYIKKLLSFSLMSLSGIVSLSVSLLFVRTFIINNLGIDYAGYWDGLWRISSLYLFFLTSSFKFYILPTFATTKLQFLKREVFRIWKITFPAIILIVICIFVLKDFLIRFLFTPEFLLIKSIIVYQLLGDIFRIHSWTLGNILLAKKKTRIFVSLQAIWGITFCSLSFILISFYQLKGITLAYFLTCILHFLFLNLALRNVMWRY